VEISEVTTHKNYYTGEMPDMRTSETGLEDEDWGRSFFMVGNFPGRNVAAWKMMFL
jgi:hypothetical protein